MRVSNNNWFTILKIIRKISSIIHFQNEITIIILNYVPNKISFNKKKLTITEFGIKISVLKTLYPFLQKNMRTEEYKRDS